MTNYKYSEQDLNPGHECPVCGEQIVTWWDDKLRSPEDSVKDANCWVDAELVEPAGLTTSFSGNVIVIDHVGPQME